MAPTCVGPKFGKESKPFVLLFARNTVPKPSHRFYFTAPTNDPGQNALGRFRIDYEATQPISVERVEKQPWVLKTLSLGTWRDVEVMGSILATFPRPLARAWANWEGKGERTGQGYNLSPDLKQTAAPFLGKLRDFEPPDDSFTITFDSLCTFRQNHGCSSV